MAEKYELGRIRFGVSAMLPLQYSGDVRRDSNDLYNSLLLNVKEDNDFVFAGKVIIKSDFGGHSMTTLNVEIRHIAKLRKVKFILRPDSQGSNRRPFEDMFRKLDGTVVFKNAKGSGFFSSRIQILNLNGCNTFNCYTCPEQGNSFCFKEKLQCTTAEIRDGVFDNGSQIPSLHLNFTGSLISYGFRYTTPVGINLSSEFYGMEVDPVECGVPRPVDLIITADERKFETQMAVLAERSDVFSAMFSSDFKEKKTGIWECKDSSADAIEVMLKYFEFGVLNLFDKEQVLPELLNLAHKYNIVTLKDDLVELCTLLPIEKFGLTDGIQMYCFAQLFKSKALETRAIDLFKRFKNEILDSKEMECAMMSHPLEMKKLLSHFMPNSPN